MTRDDDATNPKVVLLFVVAVAMFLLCGGCRLECNVHHSSKATPTEATR